MKFDRKLSNIIVTLDNLVLPSFCLSSIMCLKVGVTDFGRTLVSVTLGIFLTLIK